MARLSKYDQKRYGLVPIYGAAADLPVGTMIKVGVTADTDLGACIKASGSSDIPGVFGVLEETLDYSSDGETLQNGTSFVRKKVGLAFNNPIFELEFSQATADSMVASSSSTTVTVGSLEDNIDTSWVYVTAGTGRGQLQYLTAAASGSATMKAALGTTLDGSTSRIIKILRRFHQLVSLTSDGTKLSSQAAVGAVNARILDIRMIRSSEKDEILDPTVHPGKTGLHNAPVKFVADVIWLTTASYTID